MRAGRIVLKRPHRTLREIPVEDPPKVLRRHAWPRIPDEQFGDIAARLDANADALAVGRERESIVDDVFDDRLDHLLVGVDDDAWGDVAEQAQAALRQVVALRLEEPFEQARKIDVGPPRVDAIGGL